MTEFFCRNLPKVELHAHLNGSLSISTIQKLKRLQADLCLMDNTNAFLNEFPIGDGDSRNLSECFQMFGVAHSLTVTAEALALATTLTLQEFEQDGCNYIELRSTPRETPHLTLEQYIKTIVNAMRKSRERLAIISRLIVSIDRRSSKNAAEKITKLAIAYFNKYPDTVVGLELSGDPTVGSFKNFEMFLHLARKSGLKISVHCGEVCNPQEVLDILSFAPDRIGHAIYVHPRLGGNELIWSKLCESRIPIEVCLTSNVKTKSIPDYDSHHFLELYEAKVPLVICTDDKGVFVTSLSQEYQICAETFQLDKSQLAYMALNACNYIFDVSQCVILKEKVLQFIKDQSLTEKEPS